MLNLSSNLVNLFGVHYFASELTRNGLIPVVTSRNTEATDILVCDHAGTKAVTLQVKTRKLLSDEFLIVRITKNLKTEKEAYKFVEEKVAPSPSRFYVLVRGVAGPTEYFVYPSRDALKRQWAAISEYLGLKDGKVTKTTRSGAPRKFTVPCYWAPQVRFKGSKGLSILSKWFGE